MRQHLQGNAAFMRHYMLPYWQSILLASLCSILLGGIAAGVVTLVGPCMQILAQSDRGSMHSLVTLFGPNLGAWISNLMGQQAFKNHDLLFFLPSALLVLASVKAACYISQSFLWERLGELISKDLRSDLLNAFVYLDPHVRQSDFSREREADISSTVSTDIKLMREYLVHFYGGMPRELLQVLLMGSALVLLSPQLFLIFFLGVLPAIVLIQKLGKKLRKRAGDALSDYAQLSEWLQQRLLGIETIKHYHTEACETEKFAALNEKLYRRFLKAARTKAKTSPIAEMIAIAAIVLVLYLALSEIESGQLTGSVALSFFATLAILNQSAAMMVRYFNSNREGAAAIQRIRHMFEFMEPQVKKDLGAVARPQEQALLRCEDLWVRYPGTEKFALSGFSAVFHRGKIHAVAGPSGVGKSTLFSVILGLLEPERGRVFLHERFGAGAKLHIGYLPQQPELMSGTIAENLAYPDETLDEARIVRALKEVNLAEFVDNLPHGIQTRVGQNGKGLSGGQLQRMFLARLHYHRFPLILIDEGTSALDPELEQQIFSLLRQLRDEGSTILMIAHRPSAIQFADEVLYL